VKKNKNHGWCIIIEGLSGSGKTSISKKILTPINKKIGKTIFLDGDAVREFLLSIKFKMGYKKRDRGNGARPVSKLINIFLENNINIIYANVGLNKIAVESTKLNNLINMQPTSISSTFVSDGQDVQSLKNHIAELYNSIQNDISKQQQPTNLKLVKETKH